MGKKKELKAGGAHTTPPHQGYFHSIVPAQRSPSLLSPVTSMEEGGLSVSPRVLAPVDSWLLTCHLPQSSGFSPSAGASCVPPPPCPLPSHPFSFHACWLRAPPSLAPSAANLSLCPVFATFPLPRPPVRSALRTPDGGLRGPNGGCPPVSPWVPATQARPTVGFSVTFMRQWYWMGLQDATSPKHNGGRTFQKAL